MDYGKEFQKYAVSDHNINSNYYDKIVSSMLPQGMTPNIIEERQMNAVAMDVFSRLMMDRKVQMPQKIFKFTLTLLEVVFMRVLVFMIPCNSLSRM